MAISLDIDGHEICALVAGTIDRIEGGELERIAAGIVRESVVANFGFGGRPAWKPLQHREGSPLIKTGRLKNSIYSRYDSEAAYVYTAVKYAPTHQFGAERGEYGRTTAVVRGYSRANGVRVRGYAMRQQVPWGDVPARPFMMVQDEDIVKIQAEYAKFIENGR
jgi:phage gpG-like protein